MKRNMIRAGKINENNQKPIKSYSELEKIVKFSSIQKKAERKIKGEKGKTNVNNFDPSRLQAPTITCDHPFPLRENNESVIHPAINSETKSMAPTTRLVRLCQPQCPECALTLRNFKSARPINSERCQCMKFASQTKQPTRTQKQPQQSRFEEGHLEKQRDLRAKTQRPTNSLLQSDASSKPRSQPTESLHSTVRLHVLARCEALLRPS